MLWHRVVTVGTQLRVPDKHTMKTTKQTVFIRFVCVGVMYSGE
jgi:hypothetical protein